MKFRLPALQNATRQHGVTVGQITGRNLDISELRQAFLVGCAKGYCDLLFDGSRTRKSFLPP
jgi:hypothetical protein